MLLNRMGYYFLFLKSLGARYKYIAVLEVVSANTRNKTIYHNLMSGKYRFLTDCHWRGQPTCVSAPGKLQPCDECK